MISPGKTIWRRTDSEYIEAVRRFHHRRQKWATLVIAISLVYLGIAAWHWFVFVGRARSAFATLHTDPWPFEFGLMQGYLVTRTTLAGIAVLVWGLVMAFGGRKDRLLLSCWAETCDETNEGPQHE